MTKKIFQSILLVAGCVLLASLLIIMGFLYDYFGGVEKNQLRDELSLAAAAVEDGGTDYLSQLTADRYRLTWIAADGSVLYDTRTDAESLENHASRAEVSQALATGIGESTRYSSTLMEKTMYYAQRLDDGTVLRISISRATVGMIAVGMIQPLLIVLIVALILSGLLARRLSRRIVDPLNSLDLEHPLDNDAYEELSPLLKRIHHQHVEIQTQLRELREKAEASNLPEDAQAANDFENKCVRFEKKLHDLELTRMISLQTAPQIRMIQNNDTALVEKIQTSVLNTIPLWKNQMVLTLGIENSRRAMEAQRQVTDMTNALLQKNADMLHMASVETAKESERGIVDMETLKHTNEQLISTLDEVLQIQTDGAKKRQEAEQELRRLEGELKQKLLQPRS